MPSAPLRSFAFAFVLSLLGSLLLAQQPTPPAAAPPQDPTRQDPTHAELRAQAFAAERAGRFGAAADAFVQLVKAEPQRVEWHLAAGRCLGRAGRWTEAIELLDQARQRFADVIELTTMLARTMLLQAETPGASIHPEVLWADACDLAKQVLQRAPDDEEANLLLAQARLLQGDRDTARQIATQVVQRHPTRAGGHVMLGRLAFDEFRQLVALHRELRPEGQEAADLAGEIAKARTAARENFTKAAELDPTRAHPHLVLGQIAWLDNDAAQARSHLARALDIDPDQALDHDLLTRELDAESRAAFYRERRQRHEAGPTASAPKAATLRFHEGRALFQARQWQAARDCFAAALHDRPEATNNLYYLFLASYELGEVDAAEQFAARYAATSVQGFADVMRALDGDQRGAVAGIVKFLADRAYQQQRLPVSRDLNHVIAALRDDADAWNNHAFLCRETGDFAAALSSYRHAIDKEPESPQLWNDAAVILQYHQTSPDNLQKARQMYERALQLADKALADRNVVGQARERATKAKADATANLAELAK